MDTGVNVSKQGHDLADKAADKIQSGIRTAKDAGSDTAEKLTGKVEDVSRMAGSTFQKVSDQTESMAKETFASIGAAAKRARATVADVGDNVIEYTKDHPLSALLISAAVGAVIGSIAAAWSRSRD